ncbi:MAG TPA: hypothetical protein VL361_03650 [Candidatus Limnocylindrales bacterium]|nr:hypothetical protein [Candidatus Limnocylindrales bacterium]
MLIFNRFISDFGFRISDFVVLPLCLLPLLAGCVSKSKAQAQARAAFIAGQQQAMQRMQQAQAQGPSVTFIGEVRNNIIPWRADLTLAKAIVAADYYGATDPGSIILIRDGQQTSYDPAKLLQGDDILLEPRDVVEIRH